MVEGKFLSRVYCIYRLLQIIVIMLEILYKPSDILRIENMEHSYGKS